MRSRLLSLYLVAALVGVSGCRQEPESSPEQSSSAVSKEGVSSEHSVNKPVSAAPGVAAEPATATKEPDSENPQPPELPTSSPRSESATPTLATAKQEGAKVATYGVYLNGSKMGWMELSLEENDKEVIYKTNLEATIRGMGSVSDIKMTEARIYNTQNEQLQSLEFEQKAATGSVKVIGKRVKDGLSWTTKAGGAEQNTVITSSDSLSSIMTLRDSLRKAKVGDSWKLNILDASMARDLEVIHTLTKIETRQFAGVESRVFHIRSSYVNAGVEETSLFDEQGELLESTVGQFFKALREPPEIAKRKEFQQDLLVSSTVKTPDVIENQTTKRQVSFIINGFGDRLPPESARQKVQAESNGRVKLTLTRDPDLPTHSWPLDKKYTSGAPKEFLESTPYLQSDSAEIIEISKRVVAPARDVAGAVQRLNEFVYRHVRDAYVPAFSNALEALKTGKGDCTEHSALFVAMARAVGIPARVVVGVGYWRPGDGLGWHAWAEVFIDGRWYATDPTWGQTIADATHLQLAGGDLMEQAQIIMLLGKLRIESMSTL